MLAHYKRSLMHLFSVVGQLRVAPLKNSTQCLIIQQLLVRKILYAEQRIREIRHEIKSQKRRLGTVHPTVLDKASASEIKALIQHHERRMRGYQQITRILRSIGDALVYLYIPKWPINALASKENAGFLSGKSGFRVEQRILMSLFKLGGIGILCDLTNCLRYGDIIAVTRRGYSIIEAKASNNENRRTSRQFLELKQIEGFLNTGRAIEPRTGAFNMLRVQTHSPQRNHRATLNGLVREARKTGTAFLEVEKGLEYYAAAAFHNDEVRMILAESKNRKFCFNINHFKNLDVAYYPLTLSIEDPDALFAYYAGQLIILVLVDRDFMITNLASSHIAIEFHQKSGMAFTIRSIDPNRQLSPIGVTKYGFGRVAYEFLSLEWFLKDLAFMLQHIEQTKNHSSGLSP